MTTVEHFSRTRVDFFNQLWLKSDSVVLKLTNTFGNFEKTQIWEMGRLVSIRMKKSLTMNFFEIPNCCILKRAWPLQGATTVNITTLGKTILSITIKK